MPESAVGRPTPGRTRVAGTPRTPGSSIAGPGAVGDQARSGPHGAWDRLTIVARPHLWPDSRLGPLRSHDPGGVRDLRPGCRPFARRTPPRVRVRPLRDQPALLQPIQP